MVMRSIVPSHGVGSPVASPRLANEVRVPDNARRTRVTQPGAAPGGGDATVIQLRWKAARAAAIFPSMEAQLSIYPLSKDETQLELHGIYRPPLGALDTVVDALVGHRIAEASVHRFVVDIAQLLGDELGASPIRQA